MSQRNRKTPEESPSDPSEGDLGYLGEGFPALHGIRDKTLLLSLGNAFLCEEGFLKKTGVAIESQLDNLRQEIVALKMRFPGKFATEIDTDGILEDLEAHSRRLQNPNKGLIDKCTIGALGRALEETLDALTAAVRTIKRRVEGETPAYTAKDSVLGVIDKAKTPASMVTRLVSMTVKAVLVLLLLSLGPLTYLLLSMDRESALLKEIAQSEAAIQTRTEAVLLMEKESEAIRQRMEAMKGDDAPRETKLQIMEMNVEVHSLDQSRNRAEAEISAHQEKIREKQERLQAVREKPFLARLLRR